MVSHRVERKTRVTGDEAPSFARKFSSRERSGCEAGSVWCPSFRAEKRSAQASARPLSQAQGGLFCVLTVLSM